LPVTATMDAKERASMESRLSCMSNLSTKKGGRTGRDLQGRTRSNRGADRWAHPGTGYMNSD
jgi:hypothetical protein